MALTKVTPAGIGSTPGTGYVIGDSFLHSTGLNATNAYYTGIVTSQNIRVLGDLQVDGTTTTLDTAVTEVDKLEVAANNTTVGVAITQSGSGDILNLYDGSSEVFSVADGGAVTTSGDISVGGDLTLPDAIVHSGDTDTKIRFPATDTVTVETAGSERLRITSAGKVGIGTDNPTATLEVATSVDGEATLATFKNTSGGGTNETVDIKLGLENTVASNVILRAGKESNHSSGGATDNFFAIHTTENNTSAERLRITSDGKVGIGTDNPDYNLTIGDGNSYVIQNLKSKNDEFGEFRFGDPEGVAQGKITYDHGTDSLRFTTNGDGEKLRIASDGKILTAGAATVPLTSAGGIDACSGLYSVVIGGNTGGGSNQNQRTDGGNKEGRLVSAHKTNAEEPVSIATIFNLGTQNLLYFGGGSSLVNAATDIAFYTAANTTTTGGTERVRITSDGKIAIGGNYGDTAAFGRQVLISGTVGLNNDSGNIGIGFNRGSSNTYGYIGTGAWAINGLDNDDFGISSGTTGDLVLGTGAGTERLRIASTGQLNVNQANNNNLQGQVTIFEGTDFNSASQGGRDNIYLISDRTSGNGRYGASIGWSRIGYADRRAAAIVNVQTSSDEDQVGLAFFTHPSSTPTDAVVEKFRITHDGQFEMNGVRNIYESFYITGNQAYNWDFTVPNEGGSGNSFYLVAGFNHYYTTAYGAHRVAWFSARGTAVSAMIDQNQTHYQSGGWTVSKPNSTTFRVTKTAGSLNAPGYGFFHLMYNHF
jgi:hypothetical protein